MKLISATSILLISSYASGVANAALPPGYQEFMHCPPGSCSLYIEHDKGFAGPASAYYKCYDETTEKTTEAVWTGQYTEIEAPEGWIQDPGECEPPMSDPTTSLNIDKPGGLCTKIAIATLQSDMQHLWTPLGPDCVTVMLHHGDSPLTRLRAKQMLSWRCVIQVHVIDLKPTVLLHRMMASSFSIWQSVHCAQSILHLLLLEDSPRSRPKKHTRSTTSSSTSTSSDAPPSISKKRNGSTTTSSSTSTSSDESPPSNPIKKKRRPAYLLSATSTSATSDDSSTGIVSPTPAPAPPVQAVAEM
ncbi:hypothetical protein QTG54_002105 [Skeletonema marinoi]|uniref:Uncharacterized protein n=1 Tax=Skeletonema marinoi TaxID=267567 RepID=A0AAD8YKH1_9STRA|nr:hypothetical protein QTG54_002105 [Skeletonema marinoi]